MELKDMIAEGLGNMAKERASKKAEVTKYNVRYKPCGHTRAIKVSETELIALVIANKGKLTLSSDDCPTCFANYVDEHYDKEVADSIVDASKDDYIDELSDDLPTDEELIAQDNTRYINNLANSSG